MPLRGTVPEAPSWDTHLGGGDSQVVQLPNFCRTNLTSTLNTLLMFQRWTKTASLSTSLSPSNSSLNLAGLLRGQNIKLAA